MAENEWRIDRNINVALLGGFLLQFAAVVWWGANLTARIDAVERAEPNIGSEFSKLESAREANDLSIQKLAISIDNLRLTLEERTKRFENIQSSLERIEASQNKGK